MRNRKCVSQCSSKQGNLGEVGVSFSPTTVLARSLSSGEKFKKELRHQVKLLRERLFYLGGKEDDERKELKSNKLWESEIRFCHGSKLQHYKVVAKYSRRCFALVEKIDEQIKQGKTTITRSKELSQALFLTLYGRSEAEKYSILEKLANQEIKVSEIKKFFPSKDSEQTSSEEQRSIAAVIQLERDNKKLHEQIERLRDNIKEINEQLMVAERENKRLTAEIRKYLKRKLRKRGNVTRKRKRTTKQSSAVKKKTVRRTKMASDDDDDEDDVEDVSDDDDDDDDDDEDYNVDDDDYSDDDDDDDDDGDNDDNELNESKGEVRDDGEGNQKTLWIIPCLP
ncbi:hypothetical protein ABFA07_004008 [Porites harrisoni]